MKTLKTLKTIAAVMAVSFSASAMANIIPGLPDTFFGQDGAGVTNTSITKINSIITEMGLTQGSVISTNDYWNAFIADTTDPTEYFDYANAKPFIQELVFTVESKQLVESSEGTATLSNGSDTIVIVYNKISGFYDQTLSDGTVQSGTWEFFTDGTYDTVVGGGKFVEAHYEEDQTWNGTDEHGVLNLVSALNDGSTITKGDIDQKHANVAALLNTLGVYVNGSTTTISGDAVRLKVLSAGADLQALAESAIVKVAAFNNANALIKKIATFNKSARLLDVEAATAGLVLVINKHNGFLGASIKQKALALRDVLKQFANQTAASATGKALAPACEGQFKKGTNIKDVCTSLGKKFVAFATTADSSTTSASDYNSAIGALKVFANSIIDFNDVAYGYDAVASASSITGMYGAIDSGSETRTIFGDTIGFGDTAETLFDGFDSDFTLNGGNGDLH